MRAKYPAPQGRAAEHQERRVRQPRGLDSLRHPLDEAAGDVDVRDADMGSFQAYRAGGMFLFCRKRLAGSHAAFTRANRS
jgi:hypothetical protein